MSWLLTTAIMAGVIALPVAVGLVVARVLGWNRPWTDDDWLDAPFLGISAIILLLQNAIYFGFPLRLTSWPFVALLGVAFALMVWRGRIRGIRAVFPTAPFLIAIAVVVMHGVGLWIVGIKDYTGRAWGDQINYNFIAHYLIDFVFGSRPPISEPAALMGFVRSQSRIGQSTLHGFFTTLFPIGTKALFEPTVLLSAPLVSLAIFAHGVRARLPVYAACLLAGVAGALPAVAAVHLESFLSHALALPFLLYLPVLLDRAVERSSWSSYLRAGLVAASTTAIYLEFYFFVEACVLVFAAVAWFEADRRWRNLPALAMVALLPSLLRATHGLAGVLGYLTRPVLAHVYPWASSLEGIERLWAGDLVGVQLASMTPAAHAVAVALLGVGYLGLFREIWLEFIHASVAFPKRLHGVSRAMYTCALAMLPLAILIRDDQHPYQFYKLLLTVAPLVVWGAGCAAWHAPMSIGRKQRELVGTFAAAVVGIVAASGTFSMARASAKPSEPPRHWSVITQDPGFRAIENVLSGTYDRDVIQCVSDRFTYGYANGWLTLLGKRNRIWVLNPQIGDELITRVAGPDYFKQIPGSLPGPIILTSTALGPVWASPTGMPPGTEFGSYRMVEPGSQPVTLMCSPGLLAAKDGKGQLAVTPDGADLVVYSNQRRDAIVVLNVSGDDPAAAGMSVRVDDETKHQAVVWKASGVAVIPLKLTAGVTRLNIVAPLRRDGQAVVADGVSLWLVE